MKILKKAILLATIAVMAGCQTTQQDTPQSQESMPESQSVQESSAVDRRADGTRKPWTNYSEYATPDEEGYAYEIYNDPDISSEIMPITASSPDVLLFTFDDAPQTPGSHAIQMAELMKRKDVNAIFLVNGMYLDSDYGKEIVRKVHDMGFEIGNHTETHADQRTLETYEAKRAEIQLTNEKIEAITGEKVRWFRPPFGRFDMDTINICNDLGLQLMTWSFGYDWMDEYQTADALAHISTNNEYIRSGGNILMHDREWTYGALERMIDAYRAKGYHIVDPYLIKKQVNSTAPLEPNHAESTRVERIGQE